MPDSIFRNRVEATGRAESALGAVSGCSRQLADERLPGRLTDALAHAVEHLAWPCTGLHHYLLEVVLKSTLSRFCASQYAVSSGSNTANHVRSYDDGGYKCCLHGKRTGAGKSQPVIGHYLPQTAGEQCAGAHTLNPKNPRTRGDPVQRRDGTERGVHGARASKHRLVERGEHRAEDDHARRRQHVRQRAAQALGRVAQELRNCLQVAYLRGTGTVLNYKARTCISIVA